MIVHITLLHSWEDCTRPRGGGRGCPTSIPSAQRPLGSVGAGGSRHVTTASLDAVTIVWRPNPRMATKPLQWRLVPTS